MDECNCCRKDVSIPSEKKQRRLLSSLSTATVLKTLLVILKLKAPGTALDEIKLAEGFICRPCFRLLERYEKLQKEVLDTVNIAPTLLLVESAAAVCETPTRKKSCRPPARAPSISLQNDHTSSPSLQVCIIIVYGKLIVMNHDKKL